MDGQKICLSACVSVSVCLRTSPRYGSGWGGGARARLGKGLAPKLGKGAGPNLIPLKQKSQLGL